MKKLLLLLVPVIFLTFFTSFALAVPSSEQVSAEQRNIQVQEREKQLRNQVEQKAKPAPVKEELPPAPPGPESDVKTVIKQINVTGVTFLPEKTIQAIILPYQGKELTMREMQKVADLITDAYRQKGYITSRAYLPPQKIENGTLEIRVIEGRMGKLNVTGNKYFKASIFQRRFGIKQGDPFDYNKLRVNLSNINQYPDRSARAVIVPGTEPGTTDVNLEVKDRLPIHIGMDVDNFGSRFIDKWRYEGTLKDNNLLGFDDALTLQYQLSQAHAYSLDSLRYLVPVTDKTEIGYFMAQTKLSLKKEFEALDARGKGKFYSLYMNHELINTERTSLQLRAGFDYKDVFNFQAGHETSRDRMRVLKGSANLDVSDDYGRTVVDNEMDFGIPGIMGGLEAKDPSASRPGSGGRFYKDTIDILRLQKLPLSTTLLWKNQIQLAGESLTSTEEFQMGGIANLRGYPPAEVVGDNGYTTTLEWSVPPYFISKNIQVPYSQAKLYDALRFVTFFDWGFASLRNPQAGEKKNNTLKDVGCGMRFNLPENFSIRIDIAWALGKTPSDGDHVHPWFQISKEF